MLHSWPSGLRRHVQVVISPEAWVRTPLSAYIYMICWVFSSVAEHGIADPEVAGSTPAVPFIYILYMTIRGISSIGRARRLQRRGTGIEARILHIYIVSWVNGLVV